jgi:hypothetical protein
LRANEGVTAVGDGRLTAVCFFLGTPATTTNRRDHHDHHGANEVERKAAEDANQIQDACNLVAIIGCWHRHLLALQRAGIGGDNLINHPTSLAFVSKLNSLCRMSFEREMAALQAIDQIEKGESVEYQVIPL